MSTFLRQLYLWLVCAAELWSFVNGATNHTVLMGISGSFFDPPVLSAQLGDTVTFVFGSGVHSATQSSYENPCVPLKGGFNSGIVNAMNTSLPVKSWDLVITNISEPIYYFCQATRPASHCGAGMVGAINPPSIDTFNEFVSSAKAVSGTPTPTPGVTLSGIGAFATASPAPPPGATTSTPSPPTTITTTAPPTSTSSLSAAVKSSSPSTRTGAIAGGVIGGFIAISIIAFLIFLLRRSHLRLQQKQFIDNASVFKEDRPRSDEPHMAYATSPRVGQQFATLRPLPSPPRQYENTSPQLAQVDVHALAQEVAALIRLPGQEHHSIPSTDITGGDGSSNKISY